MGPGFFFSDYCATSPNLNRRGMARWCFWQAASGPPHVDAPTDTDSLDPHRGPVSGSPHGTGATRASIDDARSDEHDEFALLGRVEATRKKFPEERDVTGDGDFPAGIGLGGLDQAPHDDGGAVSHPDQG